MNDPADNLAHGQLPSTFVELPGLGGASVDRRLGYFRDAPFVLFSYAPAGGEVVWKDGDSTGFGTGGWRSFLEEIAPHAAARGAFLGHIDAAGTHVLVLDRVRGRTYAAPRREAEAFVAAACGGRPPSRRCLCAAPATEEQR